MVETKIMFCMDQNDFEIVNAELQKGWILNPNIYDGKPLRLEAAVVYHLAKYSEEELTELNQKEEIVSVKSVDLNEVDDLLKEGYVVKELYAKNAVLVKMGKRGFKDGGL